MSAENRTSNEIVAALRQYNYWLAGPNNEDESSLVRSAADEIERLQSAWDGIFGERDRDNAAQWVADLLANQRDADEPSAVRHEKWCNALDYHDERLTGCNCGAAPLNVPPDAQDQAGAANLERIAHTSRTAEPPKPAHEREPPHCSTCGCGIPGVTPEMAALFIEHWRSNAFDDKWLIDRMLGLVPPSASLESWIGNRLSETKSGSEG